MDGTGIRGVVADRWWLRFGTVVAGSETKEKGRSQGVARVRMGSVMMVVSSEHGPNNIANVFGVCGSDLHHEFMCHPVIILV